MNEVATPETTWLTWTVTHWPIIIICAGMIAAAVIDWWKFKVPNNLTFPLVFSGWFVGLLSTAGLLHFEGGLGYSLLGTLFALALMLPIYAIGGMGAGDVKMTMGFGAWIGAFYGWGSSDTDPNFVSIIWWAWALGVIAGGVIATGMIIVRGNYRQNFGHVKEILGDFTTSSGVGEVADRANKRRPRWHRLPYGVPLCIGFVSYLVYYYATLGM